MSNTGGSDRSPLDVLCSAVESVASEADTYSVERPWKDGWCVFRGPICNFFVGESRDADGTAWISFGPIARRAGLTGHGDGVREELSYHLREAGRERRSEAGLPADGPPSDRRALLDDLHARVVDDLGGDALLWDGWVVWGWASSKPWPSVPGLAG